MWKNIRDDLGKNLLDIRRDNNTHSLSMYYIYISLLLFLIALIMLRRCNNGMCFVMYVYSAWI